MRQYLEAMNHQVEEASDGLQALERVHLRLPDLVMLDLVMPNMTGLELLTKIRESHPQIPVIIATSDVQQGTAEEALRLGARALIKKPLTRAVLEVAVAAALAGGSSGTLVISQK